MATTILAMFAPTITPLTTREEFKMTDEKGKESLALDVEKQKEFEEKIKAIKDKVRRIYFLDISGCCLTNFMFYTAL
jgi:hypothetical protein